MDGENLMELTPEVFAWVEYDARDEVETMEFDLSESRSAYAGEQRADLFYNGQRYLLRPGMSLEAVRQLFGPAQPLEVIGASVREYAALKGTGLRLNFQRQRLTTVTVQKTAS